ncbi:hypothetical protein KP014_02270 [Paenibacillus sophorae]|nr:hypothetical protein [Paenibacillus sophorae]QWU16120.1 hypothetical protein KP014_02270 [Paenibacillus sophorae]
MEKPWPSFSEQTGVRITNETDRTIAGFAWVTVNKLIFAKDDGGNENYHIYVVGVKSQGTASDAL